MIILPGENKTPPVATTPEEDEFAAKRSALRSAEDDAYLRRLDGQLTAYRARLMAAPPEDQSDDSGPDDDTVTKSLRQFDDFTGARLSALGDPALRKRAEAIVTRNRAPFETRLKALDHNRRAFALLGQLEVALTDFRSGASLDPDAAEPFWEKGIAAIRAAAGPLGRSGDALRAAEEAFTKDLFSGAQRGDIARGKARIVTDMLSGPEYDRTLGAERKAALQREAAARTARDVAELGDDADDYLAAFEDGGAEDPVIAARAATLLDPDAFKDFQARETRARAVRDFMEQYRFALPSAVIAPLDALRPEPGAKDFEFRHEIHQSAVAAVRRMTAARTADPAAYAMRDPDIAPAFDGDGTPLPRAIARRNRAQREMGVPAESVRTLTKHEAQTRVAELHALAPADRAARLLAMREEYGKHYARALSELVGEGLDPASQALAAVANSPALVQPVAVALEMGLEASREGFSPSEIASVKSEVAAALDDLRGGVETGDGDPNEVIPRFIVEILAFRDFRQGGDAAEAAERAVGLILNHGAETASEFDKYVRGTRLFLEYGLLKSQWQREEHADPDPQSATALRLDYFDKLFRLIVAGGRIEGWPVASGNLQDFLDGARYPSGKIIDPNWLKRFKAVRMEIDKQHEAIERKIETGRLTDGRLITDLKIGEESEFKFCHKGDIDPKIKNELYYATNLGNFQTCLMGKARRTRDGIAVDGIATYNWGDTYDWKRGSKFKFPILGEISVGDMALALQKNRGAKSFKMISDWTGRFTAKGRIKDGVLELEERKWTDDETARR